MTDTFAYHPPGLSPARYSSTNPSQSSNSTTTTLAQSHSPLFSHSRPSSSAGPYGLAPLQEHPQDGVGDIGQERPKLVGFEQLAGESDSVGPLAEAVTRSSSSGGMPGYNSFGGGSGGGPSFNNPFQRPISPTSSATFSTLPSSFPSVPPSSIAGPSHHAFFNPLPTVNARNTRPMTAPSGPGYFHNSAGYSAAPSAFYAPQQASTIYDSLHNGTNYQYHYEPSNVAPSQFRPGTAGDPLDPRASFSSADGGSPGSSTPFFYAPPPTTGSSSTIGPTQILGPEAIRTTSGTYYPAGAILDPSNSTGHSATTSDSLIRPTTGDSSVGPLTGNSTRRRSSTGSGKTYNFVQQAGQTAKRPRRRFDEIERLYNCDYPGCTKSYGTLNHLNSHKTMQKHGPKSTPAQFKEMRKAWRERKKAEAAAAAKVRASEPPNPATLPTTTDPLGGAIGIIPGMQSSDRPRPSTSAGEYNYSMSAPFVVPPSIGGPAAFNSSPAPVSLPTNTYPDPAAYQTHFPSPLHNAFTDPYSTRPVTAPSHFFPPTFGQPMSSAALNGGAIGIASPHAFHSPTFNIPQSSPRFAGGTSSGGGGGGHDRRFSLPAPSLQNSFSSPEMKMPQPILGYNPSALLNSSNSGQNALGFGLGLSNGKLSSHGGAAEDGTFGAIKEDVEGEDRSSNLEDKH